MTPKDQKDQFKKLIQTILLQVEIPGPLKLIAKKQIDARLSALTDEEVPKIIELALRFCVVGIEKFSAMLGLDYSITIRATSQNLLIYHNDTIEPIEIEMNANASGDTAGSNGQSGVIRSNRFRKDHARKVPA